MLLMHSLIKNVLLCSVYLGFSFSQDLQRNVNSSINLALSTNKSSPQWDNYFLSSAYASTKSYSKNFVESAPAEEIPSPHYLATAESTLRPNAVEENPSLDVGPLMELTVGNGNKARIPCSSRSQTNEGLSKLVLWYKNDTRRPFLSYDIRSSTKGLDEITTQRQAARISLVNNGLTLAIEDTRKEDEAEYRCKIHYKNSPSITNRLRLKVIDISQRIRLLDTEKRPVGEHIGPFPEEKLLSLLCRANSSDSQVTLEWMVNGSSLASSWTRNENGLASSNLQLKLKREYANTLLICRLTSINNSIEVKKSILDASTTILMYYVPQATLIIDSAGVEPLSRLKNATGATYRVTEGMTVTFICVVNARPPPYNISWLHNGRIIGTGGRRWTKHNTSLVVSPVKKDDTGLYTCLASNDEGDGQSNAINIRVNHAPFCSVAEKKLISIRKNSSVSIECLVEADPPLVNFTWSFDSPTGVTSGSSNTQTYVPSSKGLGAQKSKLRSPPSPTFHSDKLNPKKSILLVPAGYEVSNVACFARNRVGRMRIPCTFQLSVFDPPRHLRGCNVSMVSSTQIKLNCVEDDANQVVSESIPDIPDLGYVLSSDVKTLSYVEVWHGQLLVGNQTRIKPNWLLEGLPTNADLTLKIFSATRESVSDPVVLYVRTKSSTVTSNTGLNSPPQRDAISESPEESELASAPEENSGPSLLIMSVLLAGGIAGMVFVLSLSIVLIRRKGRRRERRSEAVMATQRTTSPSNEDSILDTGSILCPIEIQVETST